MDELDMNKDELLRLIEECLVMQGIELEALDMYWEHVLDEEGPFSERAEIIHKHVVEKATEIEGVLEFLQHLFAKLEIPEEERSLLLLRVEERAKKEAVPVFLKRLKDGTWEAKYPTAS